MSACDTCEAQVPSIKKLYKGDIKDVPSSGPAPVMMRFADFMKVVPTYVEVRPCPRHWGTMCFGFLLCKCPPARLIVCILARSDSI